MSAPGFERQWTAKLDNKTRGVNGLAHGVTANGVTLFVPMSIVAGSSNNVYALDNDTGYVVWQRHFEAAIPAATAQCPGGMTAGATRIVPLDAAGDHARRRPAAAAPRRRIAASSASPARACRSRGAAAAAVPVDLRAAPAHRRQAHAAGRAAAAARRRPSRRRAGRNPQRAAARSQPGAAAPGGGGGGGGGGGRGAQGPGIPGAPAEATGGGGLGRPSGVVYALSSDGILHVLGLPSGKDIQRPAEFVPANARWSDTIAVDTTLYATTTGNCGGAPNAVWAIDLASESKPVVSWKSNGGPIVGRLAFATDGTIFAAIGPGTATGDGKVNAIVSLDPKTLQVKDWFTQPGVEFVTGPSVFKHNDRDIVAAATKDGRVLLLNAASLGGANHSTPLHASAPAIVPAVRRGQRARDVAGTDDHAAAGAAGRDHNHNRAAGGPAAAAPPRRPSRYGTRWILGPDLERRRGLKVVGTGGSPALERGWAAQGLAAPETPIVVNGVVFALSTGRPSTPAGRGSAAVLHAYDGDDGQSSCGTVQDR